jgi:phosphopantetheinyl transferase (holo-ACP synthase)
MLADWKMLFISRPLVARAMRLPLAGLAAPVWFASASSADLKELPADSFLTPAESARAGAFKFGQPRENFTLGRLAGKLALAAAVGASRPLTPALSLSGGEGGELVRRLRAFEIGNGERGEPVVRAGDCKSPALAVSLSHVNGFGVAVAFPVGQQVGLDLELIDARRAETVRKGVPLSAEEETWLKATDLPEATALLLLWTAREALGKALSCGLACKWETLALRAIGPAGDGVFSGRFLHQPQFRCWGWVGPEAVMSLAFETA